MKALRIISLGVALWGLSLIWPEINQHLTEPVTLKLIGGLSLVMLAYIIAQHVDWYHNHQQSQHNLSNQTRSSKPNHISRPVPVH